MSTAPDPLADLAALEGVPSAINATRDALDAVLVDRGRRPISADQRATALVASARASAELEAQLSDAPEAANLVEPALRLYAELGELASGLRSSPPQVLARCHVLVGRGLIPDDELGRPRDRAVERLRNLHRLLRNRSGASAMVTAAIAHAELIEARPFGFADGIIARAVEHMILVDAGVDPQAVIIIEAGHGRSASEYRAALQAYRSGRAGGVRDWILHCLRAVTRGAELSPVNG